LKATLASAANALAELWGDRSNRAPRSLGRSGATLRVSKPYPIKVSEGAPCKESSSKNGDSYFYRCNIDTLIILRFGTIRVSILISDDQQNAGGNQIWEQKIVTNSPVQEVLLHHVFTIFLLKQD